MAKPRKTRGRARQKARTREAIVAGAAQVLRQGGALSVAAAARAAGVSRATAFRHFAAEEPLRIAAALEIARTDGPRVDAELQALASRDPEVRVAAAVAASFAFQLANEAVLRRLLQAAVEPARGVAGRDAQRLRWLALALAPLARTVQGRRRRRLLAALSLTTGIEALVTLRDVNGLDEREALAVATWAARALVRAARA
jgi:AcrR family transcriptional regulator